jgi:hypothetical protein
MSESKSSVFAPTDPYSSSNLSSDLIIERGLDFKDINHTLTTTYRPTMIPIASLHFQVKSHISPLTAAIPNNRISEIVT